MQAYDHPHPTIFPTSIEVAPPKPKPVPAPSELFTGQENVLDEMMRCFFPTSEWMPDKIRFVLYGLGGIGKTQIALKFLERVEHQ
jgi:Cdc6-like AAA superfamily ATPase